MKFILTRTSKHFTRDANPNHPKAEWDIKNGVWYIEIGSLDELMSLTSGIDEDEIVLKWYSFQIKNFENSGYAGEIEIYDDYRE